MLIFGWTNSLIHIDLQIFNQTVNVSFQIILKRGQKKIALTIPIFDNWCYIIIRRTPQNISLTNLAQTDVSKHRCTQGGGGEGGTHVPPSKDFEKLYHKNAIKNKSRGPPSRFSHNLNYPPQKILKMTVHLNLAYRLT